MVVANVSRVEKAATQQFHVAHHRIIMIRADDGNVFLMPLDTHAVPTVHDAGGIGQ